MDPTASNTSKVSPRILLMYLLIACVLVCLSGPKISFSQENYSKEQKAEQLVNKAELLREKNDAKQAERLLFEAISTLNEGWVWVELAQFYFKTGQSENLLKVTANIRKHFPENLEDIAEIHNSTVISLNKENEIHFIKIINKSTPIHTKTRPKSTPQQYQADINGPQSNAVRSANQYLSFSGFSRKGLIQQLSSNAGDGYKVADAKAAVDSLNINWNKQAVRSAKQYLSISGFSCKGLIEQLSSRSGDGYTKSQATYGAHQAGACR